MTKKHSIALADALRGTRPNECLDLSYSVGQEEQWISDKLALADYLSTFPSFNRELWLDYVNGKSGPNGGKK